MASAPPADKPATGDASATDAAGAQGSSAFNTALPNFTQNDLVQATQRTFDTIAAYFKGELESAGEDFKLLEAMNTVTTKRYNTMANDANDLVEYMQTLLTKYQEIIPYLVQIEQVDQSTRELEQAVAVLDGYTKRLEARFKKLD